MSAGRSQAVQSVRAALSSTWHEKRAARESQRSGRHKAGCSGERAVCAALSTLASDGVHHLDDRRWRAGDELTNLDHLVIARTGVFVVDAKNWSGRIEVRGSSVLQDGRRRDDRLLTLSWLMHRVEEVMATSSAAHVRPHPVVCFSTSKAALPPVAGTTMLTDVDRLARLVIDRPPVLTAMQVLELTELLGYAFPPYDVDAQEAAEAEGLLFPEALTRHAGLHEALQRPVEDWMVWLHPEQATAVRQSYAGPARIRGAAGTGKTAVGLHRVAWLASTRPGRFLVTSYVKTLPSALGRSYARLSPSTAERVDFQHLHGVALSLLRDRGAEVRPDSGNAAFGAAWKAGDHGLSGTGLTYRYFREEVSSVIKGRALTDLEQYLQLDRVGRRTALRREQREAVWRLARGYEQELADRGQHDFTDVLRMARDQVRQEPCRTWAGVMVDEAQDLPMVGLQLLHELAGRDRTDGLLLIGDGQQAIYPGGFRLAEAGISVAGRATVLRINYRNTVEILATARTIVLEDAYDDLDLTGQDGDRAVEVLRHGNTPTVGEWTSRQHHDGALVRDLLALLGSGARPSDIAVLVQTNLLADAYAMLLAAAAVPVVLLKNSIEQDAVRVGTWARSKGMEFSHVYLPQVSISTLLLTGAGRQAREEKAELLRRTQYVAMTRARDTLWVGRLAPAQ